MQSRILQTFSDSDKKSVVIYLFICYNQIEDYLVVHEVNMDRTEAINYISETYSAEADYPFLQYPDTAVFRHANNRKWFAAIIRVQKSKLGINGEGAIDILNLKCDPILAGSLRSERGFYPAYHMNKSTWISAALDGTAEEEKIRWLIDISYDLTGTKMKKKGNKSDEF